MTQEHDLSRRRMQRLFGAAPMLPFASSGAGALLSGCGGSDDGAMAQVTPPASVNLASVTFSATPAPSLAVDELNAGPTS